MSSISSRFFLAKDKELKKLLFEIHELNQEIQKKVPLSSLHWLLKQKYV